MVNGEICLLPASKDLSSKEEEVVVGLGATQSAVGAGSGAGDGAVTDFFMYAMADEGRMVVAYIRYILDVDLHREELDDAV